MDITSKNIQSKVLDELIAYNADIDKCELHDELRKICYGRMHYSEFNTNSSKYFHILQVLKMDDDNGGKIIDFNFDSNSNSEIDGCGDILLTEKMKLDILVFLYSFAYQWMFVDEQKERRARNKMNMCLNRNIHFIFNDVNELRVPHDLCKKFIKNAQVIRSCYFVRNLLNQCIKNTFFPLTTISNLFNLI